MISPPARSSAHAVLAGRCGLAVAGLAAVLALSGCGSGDASAARTPEPATEARVAGTAAKPATTAPAASATKAATPAAAQAAKAPMRGKAFRMPSRRLICEVLDFDGPDDPQLACDVRLQSGDETYPVPNRPITDLCKRVAPGEWANGVQLTQTGAATPLCSTGVNVAVQTAPTLAYGRTWTRAGFTCRSATTGLTCTGPADEHGFSANRDKIDVH